MWFYKKLFIRLYNKEYKALSCFDNEIICPFYDPSLYCQTGILNGGPYNRACKRTCGICNGRDI
jgi:hypothetical protein